MATEGHRPRVVVVGAGFAGLWAALALRDAPVEVLLLDRNNYHTFFPLLYQVAAAELGPTEIAYPVRAILRGHRNVTFRMAKVTGVDLEARAVRTSGERISYDYLILALGSVAHFFGVEGASKYAFPLREMAQALPLRHHVLTRFERASYENDPARRRALLTFAVVGGGPTGVEFAGALAELVHGPLRRDFPELREEELRIVLLEGLDTVLPGMPEDLGAYALRRLRDRHVEVRTGAMVARVEEDRVSLKGGEVVPTHTVVWTAGVRGDPAVEDWGFPVVRQGRVGVGPALQHPDHPTVFVAGDLAWVEEKGEPLPQVAPVAIQQGEHAARSVQALVEGREPEPFRYRDPGMLAVIGRNAAVAHVGGRTFRGFPAWILWLVIHIAKLIGFRNRALVLINWAWNYIFFERAVRLILPSGSEPDSEEGERGPRGGRGRPRGGAVKGG